MNTKGLSCRKNGKKFIFNKHINVVPELIPLHAKEPIRNSFAKKKPKPIEEVPEIAISYVTKPSNICQNDVCQNLNINDDDLGRGYCSSKCVVEHSKILFEYFLMQKKSQKQDNSTLKAEPLVENNSNYPVKTEPSKIVKYLPHNSPVKSFDLPDNFQVKEKEPFPLHSPIKSIKSESVTEVSSKQTIVDDDELEIIEPRESLFNLTYKKMFSSGNSNDKTSCNLKSLPTSKNDFQTNSVEIQGSIIKTEIKEPVRNPSPDIIFVSLHKKRRKITQQSDNFETIVID